MRKWLASLLLVALLGVFSPVGATVVYVDWASGDDSTGTGTYSNPYKTIDGPADTGLGAGDEIRLAKSTIAALSGTLTFTNGSAAITTSVDLTGTLSAGDFVSKNSESDDPAETHEAWWYVLSVTSDTITLFQEYWGTSETVTGYFVTPTYVTGGSDGVSLSSGGDSSNFIKITGGWDLSTQTRDGYTAGYYDSSYGAIRIYNDSYVELAYFILGDSYNSSSYSGCYFYSDYGYLHDIYGVGEQDSPGITVYGDNALMENCVSTGGNIALNVASAYGSIFRNIWLYSNDYSYNQVLQIDQSGGTVFDNVNVYNGIDDCVEIPGSTDVWFVNGTVDTCGDHGISIVEYSDRIYIGNSTIQNCADCGLAASYQVAGPITGKGNTFSNNTTGNYCTYTYSAYLGYNSPVQWNIKDSTLGELNKGYYRQSKKESAECRSGSCMQLYTTVAYVTYFKVGAVLVESAASDLTLSIYLKDDATFNGTVYLLASDVLNVTGPELQTLTTTYAQKSVVVDASDLTVGEYITLFVGIKATTGYVYADDFGSSQ